jgi:hypothetical protein
MNRLIFLILVLFSNSSISCDEQPASQVASPDELISRTSQIVLAKAVSALANQNNEVTYRFITIKVLKGKAVEKFEILGHPLLEGDLHNFDHHNSEEFWKEYGGRVSGHTDCEIHPGFSVGGTYLIFLSKPYHIKSFENIFRANGNNKTKDKWLFYVEEKLKP